MDMQKGQDLGAFTLGLLQNIEEHERYLYDQGDEIEKLKKENGHLKQELEIMKKQIAVLHKR